MSDWNKEKRMRKYDAMRAHDKRSKVTVETRHEKLRCIICGDRVIIVVEGQAYCSACISESM
jgi:hypothetical protein